MTNDLSLPDYCIRRGSTLERSLLVKFMQRTYHELFPEHKDFAHLAMTVEQYFSKDTPLWWVDFAGQGDKSIQNDARGLANAALTKFKIQNETRGQGEGFSPHPPLPPSPPLPLSPSPIACLWMGNALDQVQGDRHAHIFLLYVVPEHRRRGVGTALMQYAENWAKQRGDRQIGLQVFQSNQAALNLYNQLGYQTQSLWMVKSLNRE